VNAGAVIAAAGKGRRMGVGTNKVLLSFFGRPLLFWSLKPFLDCPAIGPIAVVAAESEVDKVKSMLREFLPAIEQLQVIAGGRERQDSVFNGLIALPHTEVVCVHDGARPLASMDLIQQGIKSALAWGAAVPVVPVKDTIKLVRSGVVAETLPREDLRAVQTPQCFRRELLMQAYQKAITEGFRGSDDASLVERLGIVVHTFPGETENLKVTTPEDLEIVEALLRRRKK